MAADPIFFFRENDLPWRHHYTSGDNVKLTPRLFISVGGCARPSAREFSIIRDLFLLG